MRKKTVTPFLGILTALAAVRTDAGFSPGDVTIDGAVVSHNDCFETDNSGIHVTVATQKAASTIVWNPDAPQCVHQASTAYSGGYIVYAGGQDVPMKAESGSLVHEFMAGTFTVAQVNAARQHVGHCLALPESEATEDESGGTNSSVSHSLAWAVANSARGGSCDTFHRHSAPAARPAADGLAAAAALAALAALTGWGPRG